MLGECNIGQVGSFELQEIVAPRLDQRPGDRFLTEHGVSCQQPQLWKLREDRHDFRLKGRQFVVLLTNCLLPQDRPQTVGEKLQYVFPRAAQCLAIARDSGIRGQQTDDPLGDRVTDPRVIQTSETCADGVLVGAVDLLLAARSTPPLGRMKAALAQHVRMRTPVEVNLGGVLLTGEQGHQAKG